MVFAACHSKGRAPRGGYLFQVVKSVGIPGLEVLLFAIVVLDVDLAADDLDMRFVVMGISQQTSYAGRQGLGDPPALVQVYWHGSWC